MDGARPVVETAGADRAADVGREPADWDAALRNARRAEWGGVLLLLLVAPFVVLPLLRLLVDERPLVGWYSLGLFGWGLAFAILTWRSRSSAERRERWDRQTRQQIRIQHALRSPVSIGAADRDLVTAQADEIDSWAPAHFVGWPLTAGIVGAGTLADPTVPGSERILFGLFVPFSVVLLLACRRVRGGAAPAGRPPSPPVSCL